jgi:uncharacterized protein YjiS (DUF1127 family)
MERTLSSELFFEDKAVNTQASLQLARLDSRLLADAGISEAQRYEELSKPFWR